MRKSLLLSLCLLCSMEVAAQNSAERPHITVTGQAQVYVVPDEVVFNLEARTLDKDLSVAKTTNDASVRSVLALARDYGIQPRDAQTDHIQITPRYQDDRDDDKEPVFLGYEVSKKMVLVLKDVSRTEGLLSDLLKAGVNRISGVEFRSTQIRKYKDQARALAIKAAQEKASALAREIGQTIGKAHSIVEEGERGGSAASQNTISFAPSGGNYSSGESTIALGQIPISARVLVSFNLN